MTSERFCFLKELHLWKMNKSIEGQSLADVSSVFWGTMVTTTDNIDIIVKNSHNIF